MQQQVIAQKSIDSAVHLAIDSREQGMGTLQYGHLTKKIHFFPA
jgi:hypothetical protein